MLQARVAEYLAAIDAPLVITPWRSVLVCDLDEGVADAALRVLAPMGLVFDENSPWLGISACTGSPGCEHSAADVRADADAGRGRGQRARTGISSAASGPAAAHRPAKCWWRPETDTGCAARTRRVSGVLDYIRDAAEIYRQSFATIRAEADLSRFPDDVARVVVRLIHTCGQVDVAEHVAYTDDVVATTHAALAAGAPVLCDSSMVAAGITRSRLPADNEVVSLVADARAADLAARLETTRSAAAVELWADRLGGAVLAIGNAPTALFRLLELVDEGAPAPAAVLGGPVGFVGSAQSKQELIDRPRGMSYLVVTGRRGGSAMAAAAVNAIASEHE